MPANLTHMTRPEKMRFLAARPDLMIDITHLEDAGAAPRGFLSIKYDGVMVERGTPVPMREFSRHWLTNSPHDCVLNAGLIAAGIAVPG